MWMILQINTSKLGPLSWLAVITITEDKIGCDPVVIEEVPGFTEWEAYSLARMVAMGYREK